MGYCKFLFPKVLFVHLESSFHPSNFLFFFSVPNSESAIKFNLKPFCEFSITGHFLHSLGKIATRF